MVQSMGSQRVTTEQLNNRAHPRPSEPGLLRVGLVLTSPAGDADILESESLEKVTLLGTQELGK